MILDAGTSLGVDCYFTSDLVGMVIDFSGFGAIFGFNSTASTSVFLGLVFLGCNVNVLFKFL